MLASASVADAALSRTAPDAPDSQVSVQEVAGQIFLTSFIAGEPGAVIAVDCASALNLAERLKQLVVQKVCAEAIASGEN